MKRTSFDVLKWTFVLAMLMPAVALADTHLGYVYAEVTPPGPVAPGDTITVEFQYDVDISYGGPSLWEVFFDGVKGDRYAPAAVTKSGLKSVITGPNKLTVTVDLTIPETTEHGQHTIDIFTCTWDYQPWDYEWYELPGTDDSIEITVGQQDIFDFFDASVADGTLVGTAGLPQLAQFQLDLMRFLLEMADTLIVGGQLDFASFVLELAHSFTDGQPQPLDLVEGDAAPVLATRIQALIDSLG